MNPVQDHGLTASLVLMSLIIILLTENADSVSMDFVTCGSTIKLLNTRHDARVHSHDVKYGSGSAQQSVTGMPDMADHNSYWNIRGPALNKAGLVNNGNACKRGAPINCGDTIRLRHMSTGCHLHSHSRFRSPLSGNQEVSCFGNDKTTDAGDHWKVECVDDEDGWRRSETVSLRHADTGRYLAITGHQYGRPINGQNEVAAVGGQTDDTYFQVAEGAFIKPTEK